MNLLQRTLAIVSAMGTAALMTLPVLAQSAPSNNGVNSNAVDCSFINGGIGGPVDNQTSGNQASTTQTSPSSYDTASSGVRGNTSVPLGNASAPNSNSNVNQFPNEGNIGQRLDANRIGKTTYHAMMQVTRSPEHRQFDANNPSAAVAFRGNGPAGTAGHEAQMNLNSFQEGQDALRANNISASAVLPVACAPR